MSALNVKPVKSTPLPRRQRPTVSGWEAEYIPSKNGDANLLIMFHGLGDTKAAFAALGKQLSLPFTAVMSLQAPLAVPLMESSWMWYPSFDAMFNPLPPSARDPSGTITKLRSLLSSLIAQGWAAEDIHLFGWGQGGSVSLSLALNLASSAIDGAARLGSVVTICGPLEGKTSPSGKSNTPVMYFTRTTNSAAETAVKNAFASVEITHQAARGEDMPRSMDEWRAIMKFWGQVLKRDDAWKGQGEVYEVVKE